MKQLFESYRLKSKVTPWVVGAIFSAVTLFLTIILFTFHEHDPSWFYVSSRELPTYNKGGYIGAHCAALLIYLFGVAALLLVPLCAGIAYFALRGAVLKKEWDRLIGSIGLVIIIASMCNWWSLRLFASAMPGGIVGYTMISMLQLVADNFVISCGLVMSCIGCMVVASRFLVVEYAIYGLQFIFSERFVGPIIKYISLAFLYTKTLCIWIVTKSYALLSPYLVEQEQGAVGHDFETMIKDELAHVAQDPIWNKDGISIKKVPAYTSTETTRSMPDAATMPEKKDVVQQKLVQAGAAYTLPAAGLFKNTQQATESSAKEDESRARILEEKLQRFGIEGSVVAIKGGPVVTLFEYKPAIDTKISKIIALEDDLALALQAMSIRIIAPIPGTSVVGFEVANKKRSPVTLASIIHSKAFKNSSGHLPLVLGVDTVGQPVIVDMVTMPHLLVAGATGSGKSVALNAMLVSLLYRLRPDQMQLILIDPKRLEFASYADIAHLLFPIVTVPQEVIPVLRWVVRQMEERYEKMAAFGVRNIFDYHDRTKKDATLEPMPFMLVIIDELSDLMMTTGKEVEDLIARIAQMARAAGIYMIVATQRPSVDVITGLIKVNFPSRIAFRVTSKVDSRTILDVSGAEKLLGKGDMLFLHAHAQLQRVHGAYVSDQEIIDLVEHIKAEQPVQYKDLSKELAQVNDDVPEADDQLFQEVISFLRTIDEISISLLQRKFRIGYNRSARIMEILESQGHILPHDGGKMRKVVHARQ